MKTRNGYVSNSSSSSFILSFDKKPTKKQLGKMLFPDGKVPYYETFGGDDKQPTYEEVVNVVYNDLKEEATKEELDSELDSLAYHEEYFSSPYGERHRKSNDFLHDFRQKNGFWLFDRREGKEEQIRMEAMKEYNKIEEEENNEIDKKVSEIKEKIIDKNKKNLKGKKIYIVSYSDNQGMSYFEHAGIFDNIWHLRVNHH